MPLLRNALLTAGGSGRLRQVAERSRLTRPVVGRYVAGTGAAEALDTVERLTGEGLLATLDFLGENGTREQAARTADAYVSLLQRLADSGMADRAEVSVKLSALGQLLPGGGEKIATEYAQRICDAAAGAGTTVTIDMEDHTTTDSTLSTLTDLRADHPWVGAVVQAYLKRTESDCRDLATSGSRVRLCKGAYAEPASVAFQGAEVDDSYRRCLAVLFAGDGYPMVATHDPEMISAARLEAERHERRVDTYEFQMLYGVRPAEQRAIAETGAQMRVYVPFGDEWYGYFMRRLAERPANLTFFLRSLVSKA